MNKSESCAIGFGTLTFLPRDALDRPYASERLFGATIASASDKW